jgi:Flp pilus assembly protein TadB
MTTTLASPLSFTGSAARIWPMTRSTNPWLRWALLIPVAVVAVGVAWMAVGTWYLLTCIFLPITIVYRLFRRSGRRQAIANRQHAELMRAVASERR